MKCIIICAGDFFEKEIDTRNSYVIAADQGVNHIEKLGIKADICIGDFDSLGYVPASKNIKLPCEKDVTDSIAAVEYALSLGYKEIEIYGALGGKRISHSLANLQFLLNLKKRDCNAVIIDRKCRIRVLHNESVIYDKAEYISFICASERAKISLEGMKYSGENIELSNDFPLGISNEPVKNAKITVFDGYVYEIIE